MTTTAHEDQFTADPEHVTHRPYDTAAILRQNVADLERELQRQKERHAAATARLRDQIERVTSEWERVESAMASAREDLQSFIDSRDTWMVRAMAAEAELKAAREQEPVAKVTSTAELGGGSHFNVQWLKPDAMKAGVTLYTRPIPAPAPAAPDEWREVMAELAADLQACIEAEHAYRDQYSSVMRKYQNDMRIVERARALLQSGSEPVSHHPV